MADIKCNINNPARDKELCSRCGRVFRPVHCHGHEQCASCGQIVEGGDCCQGQQQQKVNTNDNT